MPKGAVKCGRKIGFLLLAAGTALLAGTFFQNLFTDWENEKEAALFEEQKHPAPSAWRRPGENPNRIAEDAEALDSGGGDAASGNAGMPESESRDIVSGFAESDVAAAEVRRESPDGEDVIAVLSIPSISCEEIVREGSAPDVLAGALGHIEGTALPGETGNCAIAGHRNYTFGLHFNRLDEVKPGDGITVVTKEDTFVYEVEESRVVEPEDVSVLAPTDEATLTLITCTPIYIATHRLIVTAKLKGTAR